MLHPRMRHLVPAGVTYRAPASPDRRARVGRGPGARRRSACGTRSSDPRAKLSRRSMPPSWRQTRTSPSSAMSSMIEHDPADGKRRARLRHRSRCPLLRPRPRVRRSSGRRRADRPLGRPGGGVRLERAHRRGRARAGQDRRRALRPAARDRPHRHVRQPHHPRPGGVGDPRDDRGDGRRSAAKPGRPDTSRWPSATIQAGRPTISSPSPATT